MFGSGITAEMDTPGGAGRRRFILSDDRVMIDDKEGIWNNRC